MPTLVLLNGPPASGKSTLARRLVETRPLTLNLDIDVIRGLLGSWLDHAGDAGLAARALASAMASTHLGRGHDVVVPQFLARVEFIDELQRIAVGAGARFVEIALVLGRDDALRAFDRRRAAPGDQTHVDAAALVDRLAEPDPVGAMYDLFAEALALRPTAKCVAVEIGDIEGTLERVRAAIEFSVEQQSS
ncbi:MAG: hypothetical protein E4H05_00230 [Acidimicrobiales bacterium]|nr:MAG: hypothetical protein E4H05_00230 [Acidimicrobiales bacterium]